MSDDDNNQQWRHIVEHVQQEKLGGDKNAWTVSLRTTDDGTRNGERALAINSCQPAGTNRNSCRHTSSSAV